MADEDTYTNTLRLECLRLAGGNIEHAAKMEAFVRGSVSLAPTGDMQQGSARHLDQTIRPALEELGIGETLAVTYEMCCIVAPALPSGTTSVVEALAAINDCEVVFIDDRRKVIFRRKVPA